MRNDELSFRLWKNVDDCREPLGISLNDICKATGIKLARMKSLRSRLALPQSDDLFLIASFLNVSMEYLLTGQDTSKNYSARVRAVADVLQNDDDMLGAVEVLLFGKKAGASSVANEA